jgi:hypothetical protein
MALGLACLQFGDEFVASADADRLRAFLRENDADKRAAMGLRGFVGVGDQMTPTLTALWHPGGDEHLFGLVEGGGAVAFVANLFGKFENLVEVTRDPRFLGRLAGGHLRGVCWIVDPDSKTTTPATPVEQLIVPTA